MTDRCTRRHRGEEGVGLVAVIGSFTLVMVVLLGTLAYIAASVRFARWEQDATAAEAAAQSGIHDFLTWLRLDEAYLENTGPSPLPGTYCGNPAIAGPDVVFPTSLPLPGKPVCQFKADTPYGWVAVDAGAAASPDVPAFHYRVIEYDHVARSVVLEAVGRSNGVFRTLQARIGIPTTTDYVYFSDYEIANPADRTAYPDNPHYTGSSNTSAECGGAGPASPLLRYAWDDDRGTGRTFIPATGGTQIADCRLPLFGGAPQKQVISGPVHSNDTVRAAKGQEFLGPFSTSNPACAGLDPMAGSAVWATACLSADANSATFSEMPEYVPPLELPGSIVDLRALAESGVGCLYQGATRIYLDHRSTDNTQQVRVKSPGTTAVANPGRCGSPAELASPGGAVRDAMEFVGGLVVVTDSTDPLLSRELYGGELGITGREPLPVGTYTGAAAVPGAYYTSDLTMREPTRQARYGNLYLDGEWLREFGLTFAAEQSIVLTGDLYTGSGVPPNYNSSQGKVGLVAGNSVEIINPYVVWTGVAVSPSGEAYWQQGPRIDSTWWPVHNNGGPAFGIQIQASILALGGSFQVQNWSEGKHRTDGGPFGELQVFGSVAQRFRGTVGMEPPPSCATCKNPQNGYWKRYTYDERLRRGQRPPFFPSFETSTWTVLWTEEHATADAVRAP